MDRGVADFEPFAGLGDFLRLPIDDEPEFALEHLRLHRAGVIVPASLEAGRNLDHRGDDVVVRAGHLDFAEHRALHGRRLHRRWLLLRHHGAGERKRDDGDGGEQALHRGLPLVAAMIATARMRA